MRSNPQPFVLALVTMIGIAVLSATTFAAQVNDTENENDLAEISVMSFNIRYGSANDGENHWKHRKELVVRTIKDFKPDLLGTQETLLFQAEFLQGQLTDFEYVGRSREAKDQAGGEQCGIFFRSQRFAKIAEGHFWLSEQPNEPGSKSWDSSLPRMATWVRLWDKQTKRAIFFCNTHFDHRGKQARARGAAVLTEQMTQFAGDLPMILAGDFNTPEGSEPYQVIFETGKRTDNPISLKTRALRDSFRITNSKKGDAEGTFNGFKGTNTGGRIDWLGVSPDLKVIKANIDASNHEGRYPSDHFPVTTVIRYQDK